jgi:hypothetical protein
MTRPARPRSGPGRDGFALVSVLLLALVLLGLMYLMFALTNRELQSAAADADMTSGFFAAEAGLNVRGEEIRREFEGYRRPDGASSGDGCESELGSGDFACETTQVNRRTVTTYVEEDPRNNAASDDERLVTIPPGDAFAGLNAIEYRYSVLAEAVPPGDDRPEAILEMVFRTRLVPMFQFAAFYDKDLEILPGPDMSLDGRVHANGDLYLDSDGSTLSISGEVTAALRSDGSGGAIHRGRKDRNTCDGDLVLPDGTAGGRDVDCLGGDSFTPVDDAYWGGFGGQVRTRLPTLTVPEPEEFALGGTYYEEADVRLALDLRNGASQARPVVLRPTLSGAQPVVDEGLTSTLSGCLASDVSDPADRPYAAGGLRDYATTFADGDVRAVEYSNSFYDNREDATLRVLEVDVQGLLTCLDRHDGGPTGFFGDRDVDDRTIATERNGGLVWYLTVLGPDADDAASGYAVRVRNGATLAATDPGAPDIEGLTIASDQPAFVQGDYNLNPDWRPASFITDAINVLSNAWGDAWNDAQSQTWSARTATSTAVNAAFLSGTDVTGGSDGLGGQGGGYNGGLENYPRFHENWSGRTFAYRGSFVSLGEPRHAGGAWSYGSPVYTAPNRDWNYDVRFNQAQNLPPLSPRFVYLVQERFIRDFER